jgi:hypothetical protein
LAGCPDNAADSACSIGATLPINEDSMNLRCFQQVQRFGIDLLYPTARYVEGLSKALITPRFGGPQVPNPIFQASPGAVPRDRSLVILAGVVGVPWQDLATEDSWDSSGLSYLGASELVAEGRWDVLLGDPAHGVLPTDTLMVESVDPRNVAPYPQQHPLVGASIGAPTATTLTNPVNGHEKAVSTIRDDLQFACIFPLPIPIACTDANVDTCECNAYDADKNSPLCEGVTDTTNGTQVYAKAYPSLRELQVLKDVGDNAVVTSICAKSVDATGDDPITDSTYGYNPAIDALVDRVKESLTPKCLPSELPLAVDDPLRADCQVFEASMPMDACNCADRPGRTDASEAASVAISTQLMNQGVCGGATTVSCDNVCVCELAQLSGEERASCQAGDADTGMAYGFCYIDPTRGLGSDAAVASCTASDKRLLRFMGEGVPSKAASTFLACALGP